MRYRHNRIVALLIPALIMLALSHILSMTAASRAKNGQAAVPVYNRVRTAVNPAMDILQKNYAGISQYDDFYNLILPALADERLELQVINTEGKLLFDSNKASSNFESTIVNLSRAVHYDMASQKERPGYVSFAFPVIVDGVQVGNALFAMPSDSFTGENSATFAKDYIPSLSAFLAGIGFLILSFLRFQRDYIIPTRHLETAIPRLIRGDLGESLESGEQNEMGDIIRALDLMRLELKDSIDRKNHLEFERKELVASVSHEIKTPLASIKAYAEGLRDGIANDPGSMKRYAEVILSKTDSLIKLVNDLMQHTLQDLGSLSVTLKEHYSEQLLKGILEPLRLKFANTRISLETERELPDVLIRADALRLEQVLVNLVQNAEKYAPEGGRILVGAVLEDDCLLITVSDNGTGIPPEELPFIFDRHYRGKKASESGVEGAGLGLSICKYIIEQHGGTIFAESAPGGGSRFRFTIPKI